MNFLDEQMNLGRSRHGCVATWLLLMIVINAITASAYFFFGESLLEVFPDEASSSTMLFMGLLNLANLCFAMMLWKYRVLGFYGFVVTSIISLILNLSIGVGILQSISGLIGVAILYSILQIKDREIPAWEHLE